MTEMVAQLLEQGAEANAKRLRFLKLGLLQDHLQDKDDLSAGYSGLCAALLRRTAQEIVEHGTPFFWKNVHRSCLEAVRASGGFRQSVDYMLRMGFDSYFDWLPNGFSMVFSADPDANLVLPRLGVRVPARGLAVVSRKEGPSQLRICRPEGDVSIDLQAIPEEFRLRKIEVAGSGGAQLVMVRDPSMFESDYIDRLAADTDQAEFLARLIAKSLELIAAAMPELSRRFAGFIRWYFPIDAPDELTHNSLSVKFMSGAIFLSIAYHDFRLAEAMVHELHHNELFLLQESESLFEHDDEDVFYSPFRPDARPLNGLLHALFVFTGVAEFIARAETVEALADWRRSLLFRRTEVVQQVRFGLAQIPRERMTELGTRLVDAIDATIERHEQEVGPLRGPLPMSLARHLSEWVRAQPHLTERVRLPAGAQMGATA